MERETKAKQAAFRIHSYKEIPSFIFSNPPRRNNLPVCSLDRLTGLVAWGGDALADTERLYDESTNAILVTNNEEHFSKIKGLKIEN
jgi:hypothetical protein